MKLVIGGKRPAVVAAGLLLAGLVLAPHPAPAFDVVAGSADNRLSLRLVRGPNEGARGPLVVEVSAAPSWVRVAAPLSRVLPALEGNADRSDVSFSFSVDADAPAGAEGDLHILVRAVNGAGPVIAPRVIHLVVAGTAEREQQILTADCCTMLTTGVTYVPNQRTVMFSVPLLPVPPATTFPVSVLQDDLGIPGSWWIKHWDASSGSLQPVTDMQTGRAYFLRKASGAAGDSVPVDVDGAVLTSLVPFATAPLDSGFQEIATPFLSSIPWGSNISVTGPGSVTVPLDSAAVLGWLDPAICTLGSDGVWNYFFAREGNGRLDPWKGGLIMTRLHNLVLSYGDGAPDTSAIPYVWRVELQATAPSVGLTDRNNRFGVALDASPGKDADDVAQPIHAETAYLELFFDDSAWSVYPGLYMQDIHAPVSGTDTWNVGVKLAGYASRSVTVSWPDLSQVPAGVSLRLIDPAAADSVDMRASGSYSFTSGSVGSVRPLQILVDTSGATDVNAAPGAVPRTFMLGAAQPNPFGLATVINYGVPAEGGVAAIRVYNVAGQLVRTLLDGRAAAGYHQVNWDGRNDDGQPVKAGVYFYRLETPTTRETRKMTLLR